MTYCAGTVCLDPSSQNSVSYIALDIFFVIRAIFILCTRGYVHMPRAARKSTCLYLYNVYRFLSGLQEAVQKRYRFLFIYSSVYIAVTVIFCVSGIQLPVGSLVSFRIIVYIYNVLVWQFVLSNYLPNRGRVTVSQIETSRKTFPTSTGEPDNNGQIG